MFEPESVTLHMTADVAETGLWCGDCALPSLVRLDLGFVGDNFTTGSVEAFACTRCMGVDDDTSV